LLAQAFDECYQGDVKSDDSMGNRNGFISIDVTMDVWLMDWTVIVDQWLKLTSDPQASDGQ
jgi:hypothetical protein